MATQNKGGSVSLEELLVSSLAQTDALAKLLIEKGLINKHEFLQKVSDERDYVSEDAQPNATMKIGLLL